jgi:hypothetical protein
MKEIGVEALAWLLKVEGRLGLLWYVFEIQ